MHDVSRLGGANTTHCIVLFPLFATAFTLLQGATVLLFVDVDAGSCFYPIFLEDDLAGHETLIC